jgi:cell wall assembly regulator SMI1
MRGTTNLLEGEFEAWDPANPEPFTRLAGARLHVDGDTAVISNGDGTETVVHPGWLAFKADGWGEDAVVFMTPGLAGDETHVYSLAQDG